MKEKIWLVVAWLLTVRVAPHIMDVMSGLVWLGEEKQYTKSIQYIREGIGK